MVKTLETPRVESHSSASENRAPRFCLLGADYENSNLGIRALATGALTAILSQHGNAKLEMLEYGAEGKKYNFNLLDQEVTVEMLNIRFSKKLWLRNHIVHLLSLALLLKLIPFRRVRKSLASRNPWVQSLMEADHVLSLNYGDSFSDIYGLRRFLYVVLPQVAALLLNRSVVQLPQTIGPFKSRICRSVAKRILSRSSLVYSRDKEAVAAVQRLVGARRADRVRFCHDLAFLVPARTFQPADAVLKDVFVGRPVVGFNVSGLLWMGGYTQRNMFGLAADYRTVVRQAITHFVNIEGANVLLVPHVIAMQGEGDPIASDEICDEFQQSFPGRVFTLKPPYDERQVKSIMARCDFFVGARMHACIGAMSCGVPTSAMAYSDKFKGVLRSVGMDSAVVDLRQTSVEEAIDAIANNYKSRDAVVLALKRQLTGVSKTIEALAKDCCGLRLTPA